MQRIIIFGDSYSAHDHTTKSWDKMLAEYNYEIHNFAVCGSSTEYSMKIFDGFLMNNSFEPDDIIIFQFSSLGRIHFMHQMKDPASAAQYSIDPKHHHPGLDHTWYELSKDHLKWYLTNRDIGLLCIQTMGFLHMLKTFAENNPTNMVIVLQLDNYYYKDTFPITNYPANMFKTEIELYRVSEWESHDLDFFQFIKHTISDVRTNHLTLPNRKILADAIKDIIDKRTVEHFTMDLFLRNIITPVKSRRQYEHYVNLGMLDPRTDEADSWFFRLFNK